jgi:hypothetical protein
MPKKLTLPALKKMIAEERAKLMSEMAGLPTDLERVKADEVEADEFADTLEKDLDFMKALKIKEEKARRYLKKIQEQKARLRKRLLKNL